MRKSTRKPFSELSREDKIAEARASIYDLSHPHNRFNPNCQSAIRRWQDTLRELGAEVYYAERR